ncbi:hypothetical protein [Spongiactinospora rosea]|uniref:hypothetical protein n=1 Tax=Spongiactinospora rosea TaxID=2248750 RepID=UPI0011C04ED2|nr:hypothetical protein [Spongiactinospora rosea]
MNRPVSGSTRQVGLVAVLPLPVTLVNVVDLGVDGGDDSIWCGVAGDAPSAVGAVRAVLGFDVLSGDQRRQADGVLGCLVQVLAVQAVQQGEHVGDQPAGQGVLASLSS